MFSRFPTGSLYSSFSISCAMAAWSSSSFSVQFLRTGNYNRSYGYLNERTTNGNWWSGTAGSATYGRYLSTWTGNVYAQNNSFRGYGFALRGVDIYLISCSDFCPASSSWRSIKSIDSWRSLISCHNWRFLVVSIARRSSAVESP